MGWKFSFWPYQIRTTGWKKLVPRNCFLAQFVLVCIGMASHEIALLMPPFPIFFRMLNSSFYYFHHFISFLLFIFGPSSLSSPAATPGIIKIKTSEILQHTQPKIKTLTWATERNYAKRLALYFATIYLRMTVFHNFIIPTWHRNFMLLTLTLKIEH